MGQWTGFPYPLYPFDMDSVRAQWARLHQGDQEPLPADEAVLQAWVCFHAGDFEGARDRGIAAGRAGTTVANKAQIAYASYLEPREAARIALFLQAAERAEAQAAAEPGNANAHYLLASALGRYSQSISVAKALAMGMGSRVRAALDTAVRLCPSHGEAHIVLGAFHAEVIDKVGSLLGRTQGASVEAGLRHFRQALRLMPDSALARLEFAKGLVMLEGEKRLPEADRLCQEAVACTPVDAAERLHAERARAELSD
ncbi:hypothetical protein MW290_16310 [Aquincola tertiaricarbonis]|uniref:Tetratricopeptide repeat protein n=1 Tax=Aquincola tertiaricarbonis TaxID=391953 RepID=A0ABY4SGW1_AQUTE|nr:hypothetical protein [Aquincola tertiaricarbonis]URI10565.1 hypothetical protein MW290_16310 [Aquincola tertiaricarbonis]